MCVCVCCLNLVINDFDRNDEDLKLCSIGVHIRKNFAFFFFLACKSKSENQVPPPRRSNFCRIQVLGPCLSCTYSQAFCWMNIQDSKQWVGAVNLLALTCHDASWLPCSILIKCYFYFSPLKTKAAGEVSKHLYKVWKKVCTWRKPAGNLGVGWKIPKEKPASFQFCQTSSSPIAV